MNANRIITDTWSNEESRQLYEARWPGEPGLRRACEEGDQCGACSFFAPFNADWGMCTHPQSRHHLETVFEHFACTVFVREGWGPHSFTTDVEFHCRCHGEGAE